MVKLLFQCLCIRTQIYILFFQMLLPPSDQKVQTRLAVNEVCEKWF
jgi:hypothetical protein